ncbi:hypothetical protein [Enterobacter roggenkampii]|uniref:Uncharacterized protein n=1 Tax=Enterobacter roggenkampii TaxID=1812935 RepID=A0ABD7KPB2_9ENTR|nr:hypothetical protein [Enterobacter roggenkampii]SAD40690.1 Uncharacterised protein [Enterobacter roggenkampii]
MENSNRLAITSLIVSVCGVIIALCALGFSVYMGWLQKNNYEISVQPYITLVPTVEPGKNEYGFYLYNAGMGKGYVEHIEYFLNGRKVEDSNSDALIQIVNYFGFNKDCFAYGHPRKGDSVSLGEMNTLLALGAGVASLAQCKKTYEDFYKVLRAQNNAFTVKLRYRSIYNISYLYDSSDNSLRKI